MASDQISLMEDLFGWLARGSLILGFVLSAACSTPRPVTLPGAEKLSGKWLGAYRSADGADTGAKEYPFKLWLVIKDEVISGTISESQGAGKPELQGSISGYVDGMQIQFASNFGKEAQPKTFTGILDGSMGRKVEGIWHEPSSYSGTFQLKKE